MKTTIKYFSSMMLVALLTTLSFAQTSDDQQNKDPRILEDKAVSERLHKDWKKRNSSDQNQPVQWFQLNDAYYGSYTKDNTKYMTLYDKDGNYVYTLKKVDWSTLPATASIRSSYDQSDFKSQKVSSYWEVADSNIKGYYFETTDDKGKTSHVWADENGEFSTTVPKAKTKF